MRAVPPPTFVPRGGQQTIPGAVMGACVLWILYGSIGLLTGLLTAGVARNAGIPQIVFGLAFLITGIQVLMGKASSVLGAGIACIVFGGISLLGFMALSSVAFLIPGWVQMLALLNSLLLIVGGILAIVGNTAYRQWLATRPR